MRAYPVPFIILGAFAYLCLGYALFLIVKRITILRGWATRTMNDGLLRPFFILFWPTFLFVHVLLFTIVVTHLMVSKLRNSRNTSTQNREHPTPSIYRCILGHEASKSDVESAGGRCPQCGLTSDEVDKRSNPTAP